MNINFVCLKEEVKDTTKEYITKKLNKIQKFFKDEVEVKIVTKQEGKKQKIEVTIPSKNFIIRSEESRDTLEEAIDIVVDKIERQIRKNKTKIKKKQDNTKLSEINIEIEEEIQDESNIIKRKRIDSKPMNEEEAILQMNLLNHDFYIFNNVDTDSICVVYKRKDGNYGIIDSK